MSIKFNQIVTYVKDNLIQNKIMTTTTTKRREVTGVCLFV